MAADRSPSRRRDLTWRRLSRLMGVCLLGLWTGLFLVILIAYRPGGPWDALVAAAAFAPVLIAAVAVVWPPMPDPEGHDQWRSRAAIAWVGLIALLLVGSMLVLEIRILAGGWRPGTAALAGGGLRAHPRHRVPEPVRGPGRDRRRPDAGGWRGHGRLVHAFGIAVVMCVGAAFLMGGAAVANDLALRDRPQVPSRFGPTDATRDARPAATSPSTLGPGADGRHHGDRHHRQQRASAARRSRVYARASMSDGPGPPNRSSRRRGRATPGWVTRHGCASARSVRRGARSTRSAWPAHRG